jgi:hypothetical protein
MEQSPSHLNIALTAHDGQPADERCAADCDTYGLPASVELQAARQPSTIIAKRAATGARASIVRDGRTP